MKFDKIDLIFIILISIYFIALFIFILWAILDKVEEKEIKEKGSSRLSSKKKQDIAPSKEIKAIQNLKDNSKAKSNESFNKKKNSNQTVSPKKKKTTHKKKSSNRSSGYVSPNKRKKAKKKTS